VYLYLVSRFLDGLAGYGYNPRRGVLIYHVVIVGFAAPYHLVGPFEGHISHCDDALIFSLTSFHGRGFFAGGLDLENWIARLAVRSVANVREPIKVYLPPPQLTLQQARRLVVARLVARRLHTAPASPRHNWSCCWLLRQPSCHAHWSTTMPSRMPSRSSQRAGREASRR
jgi:hypothetical protein